MDAVILAFVVIALAAFVAAPLYRPAPTPAADHASLRATFDATLDAIREVDADEAAGLSSPQDSAAQRSQLEYRAAAMLRLLEGDRTDASND